MKTRLILVLCVLVSSVLAAPSAMAATISTETGDLSYEAAAGEVNAVVMTDGAISTDVVLTDTGAGTIINDTSGTCDVVGKVATCHLATLQRFFIGLGDKNDTYNAAACSNCKDNVDQDFEGILVGGDSGNDTLVGSPNGDSLFGGAGDDVIRGLAGDDAMWGETGNDRMFGMAGDDSFNAEERLDGSDTMRGGPGNDEAEYSLRKTPVKMSLDGRRNDGRRGEHDKIASDIEILVGGFGNDTLIGNTRANIILGGPGDDVLVGGAGADRFEGDEGNDTIRSRDHSRDIVDGGDDEVDEGTSNTSSIDTCISDSKDRVTSCERIR